MSDLGDAGRTVRRRFGACLADKASPELTLVLQRSLIGPPAYRTLQALVVDTVGKSLVRVAGLATGGRFPLQGTTLRRPILAAVRGQPSSVPAVLELDRPRSTLDGPTVERAGGVEGARGRRRSEARALAARFRDQTSDLVSALTGPVASSAVTRETVGDLVTTRLWINGTIHTASTARRLAEAAEDGKVLRLDVPGRVDFHGAGVDGPAAGKGGSSFFMPRPSQGDGSGVIVGIVDGEVGEHPSLNGRLFDGANLTHEAWGVPDSHATMLAGLVAGDSADYRGVAPAAVVRTYKIRAWNPGLGADELASGAGVQAAVEDGADLVLCAWSVSSDGAAARARLAFEGASENGALVVKSAGNRGPDPATLTRPSGVPGVVVVGACDRVGTRLAKYSSRGPVAGATGPTCVTWGGEDADPILGISPAGGEPQQKKGTSYAAAAVAGLAACVISSAPLEQKPSEVEAAICALCAPIAEVDESGQGKGAVLIQP